MTPPEKARPLRHRLTPSRSYPISFDHQTPPLTIANSIGESGGNEIEKLYWNDEDESFEVPDFHFDWGVIKDKTKTEDDARGSSLSSLRISSRKIDKHTTPPVNNTTPISQTRSGPSSASSAQILSLTDASTASASSLIPTPPAEGISLGGRSSSSHVSGGSKSGDLGSLGRSYGTRTFQRVVSAPLARSRVEETPYRRDSSDSYNVSRRSEIYRTYR